MQQAIEIHRHRNGSIDIEHYVRVGRALHGKAVREAPKLLLRVAGNGLRVVFERSTRPPECPAPDATIYAAE